MKRRLINFDAFKRIETDSLSSAERELALAEDVLSTTIGQPGLKLYCFGESDVTYQSPNGTFVHAGYKMDGKTVVFESIEELVIDENTEKQESKTLLSEMLDNLLLGKEEKAGEIFSEFIKLPITRRTLLSEAKKMPFGKKKAMPFGKKDGDEKPMPFGKKKAMPFGKKDGDKKGGRVFLKGVDPKKKKKLQEWLKLSENINGYLKYREMGPVLNESQVIRDEKGNVIAAKIPASQARNEGKILSFNWKTLETDIVVKRGKAKLMKEDTNFVRACIDLKKANGATEDEKIHSILEAIVATWPNVIYLTQAELSQTIAEALSAANIRNWDDEACEFMADGILRTAHHAYADRVGKILRVAGVDSQGKQYEGFKATVDKFFPTLDESSNIEMRVYADLYKAIYEVHELATVHTDEALKSETYPLLRDLPAILEGEIEPDLEVVEAAASWLANLVEANVPMASDTWDVSNKVHTTVSGDHPRMAQLAKQPGNPGSYKGDWGDEAPVSDGKNYGSKLADQMRNAWTSVGGSEVWPAVSNPYIPKPFGDYTMKGEKGVDKDNDLLGQWQSSETWPKLQNPNQPQSPWRPEKYKMKSDNLVTDK